MKKIKFLLAVALIAATLFTASYMTGLGRSLTGFLVLEQQTSVSVEKETKVKVSQFDFRSFIELGNYTTIYTEVQNAGSVPIEGNVSISIFDINNTLLWEYPQPTRELSPGSYYRRQTKHTPQKVGDYIVRLKSRFAGEVQETRKFLAVRDIEEPEPETITRTITITRTETEVKPPPPRPDIPPPSWKVEAPKEISMSEGGSNVFPISISNTGGEPIENLRMSLSYSENFTIDYRPPVLFNILPNETKSFLVSTKVKEGVIGSQNIGYGLKSKELRETNTIQVDIRPNSTLKRLKSRIETIQRLIGQAEAKISAYNTTEVDVSAAEEKLAQTRDSIEKAKKSWEKENIGGTKSALQEAESQIGDVFQNIFKLRSGDVVVKAPLVKPLYILIFASIAASVLLVSLYYYFREKHERRPKLLREE